MNKHLKGVTLAIIGVLIITPDTLIIRLVDIDPWSFLFWRGLLYGIGMLLVLSVVYRQRLPAKIWAIGWLGVGLIVMHALVNVAFQVSVQTTTVANTLVILATSPMFAALLGWAVLREKVPLRTWGAMFLCLVGIVVIFVGQLGTLSLAGDLLAVAAAAGLGFQFVLVRHAAPVDMVPAIALSGFLTAVIGFTLGANLYLPPDKFYLTAFLGLLLLPTAMILLTIAPRMAPAAEVSLIMLLETVLGPLWVWLGIGEEPSAQTLVGGAVVLLTLAGHTVLVARDKSG